jgi:hypothetical protein
MRTIVTPARPLAAGYSPLLPHDKEQVGLRLLYHGYATFWRAHAVRDTDVFIGVVRMCAQHIVRRSVQQGGT